MIKGVGDITDMGKTRYAYKILDGKP